MTHTASVHNPLVVTRNTASSNHKGARKYSLVCAQKASYSVTVPFVQIRKWKHGEVKSLTPDHTAGQ